MTATGIVSLGEICTGVHDVLEEMVTSGDLRRVFNYSELTDAITDLPAAEVYWERIDTSLAGSTDRQTFQQGDFHFVGSRLTLFIDVYVRRRSIMPEDWRETIDLASKVQDKLEAMHGCPGFGVEGVAIISWTGRRVVLARSQMDYCGVRFEVTMEVF